MRTSSSCFTVSLAVLAFLCSQAGCNAAPAQVSRWAERSSPSQPIRLVICTDHEKYSLGDSVTISALLENTGENPVYVDRRMFWTGLSGGLKLVISDERGHVLPAQPFSDAMMPAPRPEDTSILFPLNRGFLYGTSLRLLVKGFFPKPGRYSIRVIYQSMISKESVAPQLRNLPALWSDTPSIASEPIRIEVIGQPATPVGNGNRSKSRWPG